MIDHFSAGDVTLFGLDESEEGALTFVGLRDDVVREPDAVKWLDADHFITANEGDMDGGSRGWTVFRQDGTVVYESGLAFERALLDERGNNVEEAGPGIPVRVLGAEDVGQAGDSFVVLDADRVQEIADRRQELERQKEERDKERRSMVGSGDRSAKIRTYNFPQDRVTDHRLEGDQKNHSLQSVMDGDLDSIIDALRAEENAERLANL